MQRKRKNEELLLPPRIYCTDSDYSVLLFVPCSHILLDACLNEPASETSPPFITAAQSREKKHLQNSRCKMRPVDDQESTGQHALSVLDINQSK